VRKSNGSWPIELCAKMALDIFKRLLTKEEIENSPSRGYMSLKHEKKLRKDSCAFIAAVGQNLEISQIAIATASVYFHCFYARLSFQDYDRYEVAATCVFLSGKVEEKRKRVDQVIKAYYFVKNQQRRAPYNSAEWVKLRNTIYKYESILLDVIEYNFAVRHPYKFLLKYLNDLFGGYANKSEEWQERHVKGKGGIRQSAWFFVNDSLRSTLCLQYSSQTIAVAVIFLTLKHQQLTVEKAVGTKESKHRTPTSPNIGDKDQVSSAQTLHSEQASHRPKPKPWYEELFKESRQTLEDIAVHILEVINTEEPPKKSSLKNRNPE